MNSILTRRALIGGMALGAGGLLAGCDMLAENEGFRGILFAGEKLNYGFQRALINRNALAREFTPADLSPVFRANGSTNPDTPSYNALNAGGFADYRLVVDGLVNRPLSLSLAQLRAMPNRTQITRHDCVEGWSAIGQWTGPVLQPILEAAGLRDTARFLHFHCADLYSGNPYYETIDLVDALHPQTMLAHSLNGATLPVANGAPLRLRVERHLGYKHAKYITRIQAVDSLAGIGNGRGGYWEDHHDYDWYAGI